MRKFSEKNVMTADLFLDPISFTDNHFDYLSIFDFIEYIP